MCRLILALGIESTVSLRRVLNAARVLARGGSRQHERPEMSHTAGWGCAVRRNGSAQFEIYRSASSICDDTAVENLSLTPAAMLLIHLRNSSFNNLSGLDYAHPQSYQPSTVQWHIMHNGSMPDLAARLGPAAAHFDTASYIRYAAPAEGDHLDGEVLLRKLDALPASTSANAFIFNTGYVYVVNHYPPHSTHPRFYTIHRAEHDGVLYIASEPLTALAPEQAWTPMSNRSVVEIDITRTNDSKEAA
jgi:predicted glutamine amidotransferase